MVSDPEFYETLADLVYKTDGASNPTSALTALVQYSLDALEADSAVVHVLDVAAASFTELLRLGESPAMPSVPFDSPESHATTNPYYWVFKTGKRLVTRSHGESGVLPDVSRMIVPIVRQKTVLGSIGFESRRGIQFGQQEVNVAHFISALAVQLLEERRMLNLLQYLQTPLDYDKEWASFLRDLGDLVQGATGMRYIALREFKREGQGRLECLFQSGFGALSPSELSIDLKTYQPFAEAVEKKVTVRADRHSVTQMKLIPYLRDVESFIVAPVLVGTEVLGTLSCASSCQYEFTPIDMDGITAVANCVGVAISNYRSTEKARTRIFEEANLATSLLTAEVALGVKHEVGNHLNEAAGNLTYAIKLLDLPASRRHMEEMRQSIRVALTKISDGNLTLSKISLAHKPIGEPQQLGLADLWREAFSLVDYRLGKYKIEWRVTGDAQVNAIETSLRHAFLQLILNSIDAFSTLKQRRKQNEIVVVIGRGSEKSQDLTIRYSDNATGIEVHKLRNVTGRAPVAADIFRRNVTSKHEGSGFGMPLTRRMLQEHKGSIDLMNWTDGVTFDIRLPKISDTE